MLKQSGIIMVRNSQRVLTGLKPSFSVDFFANEGYFVSNMAVVLVGSKVAIVK